MSDHTIDQHSGKRYVLRELASSGDLRHFRLEVPGEGRIQSTDLVFTADHTAIFGDLCPGRHGVTSGVGYGLAFFSQPRSERYLAEKFLAQDWHQELAHAELDDMADENPERFDPADDDIELGRLEVLRSLHGLIDDYDVRGLGDWFTEHGYESEDIPGYGHKPRDLELLSLINRRFATLYNEANHG